MTIATQAINAQELSDRFEYPVYPKRRLTLVRGAGALVWDDSGREYIDCAAGVGVANVGHANPRVCDAIDRQARTLITVPGTIDTPARAELWRRLVEITPVGLDRAFLCNSGTETVEGAIKFARLTTGRIEFVCAKRGFHGRTLGALSATHKPEYREAFEPLVPGFQHIAFNDVGQLEQAVTDRTAGVLFEIIQGEGGVRVATPEFLAAARKICDERGALLIIDEIQTGFCRTGKMFACDHFDLRPDILCLAKGIAGGLPLGAVMCSQRVAPATGKHGTTFGGNALCCAAALATLDELTDRRLDQQAARLGDELRNCLRDADLPIVREVRGLGLMTGVELKSKVQPILAALLAKGLIALPAGTTVLRLLPPLVIEREQLHAVADRVIEALAEAAA
jgi:acetylornithine/LysW-gamma-L-lysine aminotransferase